MPHFRVVYQRISALDGQPQMVDAIIEADDAQVDSGALMLLDEDRSPILIVPRGAWIGCEKVSDSGERGPIGGYGQDPAGKLVRP